MFLRLSLLWVAVFFLYGCGSHKTVVYPASHVSADPYKTAKLDKATKNSYLSAVNRMRAEPRQCGTKSYRAAKPLVWNEALYKASYEHSKDMALCSYFSHKGSGKQSDWTAKKQKLGQCSTFVNRIKNNGYGRYGGLAENIAYGVKSVERVMQQWINSDGHCKNIMNPNFTDLGMANVVSENGTVYWTQNFGKQMPGRYK
jgi:uncharacterized protein YkwD